jgi:hypothetical protein
MAGFSLKPGEERVRDEKSGGGGTVTDTAI